MSESETPNADRAIEANAFGLPNSIKIMLVSNKGAGFAREVTIREGTTIEEYFAQEQGGSAADFKVRVNRTPVQEGFINAGYVLQPGDQVTIAPANVEGA